MKIKKNQYDHYWEHGWAAVEGVFSESAIDAALQEVMDLAARDLKASDSAALVDRSPDGQWQPRKLADVFCKSEFIRHWLFPSPIPAIIAQFMGAPPLLMADEFFFKPPRHGSAKPYHQDNSYFQGLPADHVINAWIAMDDSDEANGCLRYIRSSHREPILPNAPIPGSEHHLTPDASLIDLTREEYAPVRKGGVVFHHGNALHYSGANNSDRWRRAYATFWVAADVSMAESFRNDAYFRKHELWRDLPADSRGHTAPA